MQTKYFRINNEVVVEYNYADNTEVLSEDYHIMYYKNLDYFHFAQDIETFGQLSQTNNIASDDVKKTRQLMNTDYENKKQEPLDFNSNLVIHRDYSVSELIPYDIIRLQFPINYQFINNYGFLFRVQTKNYNESSQILLSQTFFDKEIHSADPLGSFIYATEPKIFDNQMYGKYYEIKIPSIYYVSRQRIINNTSNITTPGTLNYTINNGLGLSINAPIQFELSYLNRKIKTSSGHYYYNGTEQRANIPQAAEFQTVGVKISESTEGDYFEISGIYNNSVSGFGSFLEQLENEGKPSYVIYSISLVEQNIVTNKFDVLFVDNFATPYDYRPIIKNTSTIAAIDVELRIVSKVDNSVIVKQGSYLLNGELVNKYGFKLSKINISNAYKPKIYNPVPDQIIVKSNDPVITQTGIQYIPVFYSQYNITIKSENAVGDATSYYSNGQLELLVNPTENVFKFIVARFIQDNKIEFLSLPPNTKIKMVFKGSKTTIETELFYDSIENDLTQGIMSFYFDQNKTIQIHNLYKNGDRSFIIQTADPNTYNTVIYMGRFIIVDSDEYRKKYLSIV